MTIDLKWLAVPLSPFVLYAFFRFFWWFIGAGWSELGTEFVGYFTIGMTPLLVGILLYESGPVFPVKIGWGRNDD